MILRLFFFKIQVIYIISKCMSKRNWKIKFNFKHITSNKLFLYPLCKKPKRDFINQKNKENGISFIAVLLLSFKITFIKIAKLNG